jgi:hypothetical protein
VPASLFLCNGIVALIDLSQQLSWTSLRAIYRIAGISDSHSVPALQARP